MIETTFSQQIISAAAMVPILGAVYQLYLKKPIVVSTKEQVMATMKQLRTSPVTQLPTGSYDVTPEGAKMNYTLQIVSDEENDDTVGQLQITNSSPVVMERIYHDSAKNLTTETLVQSGNIEHLDYGKSMTIAEPSVQGKVKIFGMLLCKRKAEQIFTE